MVEPNEQKQENYKFLLALHEELISSLRDGVKLSDLYDKIKQKCQSERPELVDKLTPNFGCAYCFLCFRLSFIQLSTKLNYIRI
jgi:nucleosome binding factor SPN SPT16 subunit